MFTLAEIARNVGAHLLGDGCLRVDRVATLGSAGPGAISFLANAKYRRQLAATKASAVILAEPDIPHCPVAALVSGNPYLTYARVAILFNPPDAVRGGVHSSALVSSTARVDHTAWIGPGSIVEDDVAIGPRVFIGPCCIVGRGCAIGADTRLVARVTLCLGVIIGERVLMHPGVVVGSDGFGLANDRGMWLKVPQLGGVRIGNDVEIGANTTIDRGALDDTVIHDGVKLDNQIQVAHNVVIGEHTAIAACVGISGSTRIGSHCSIGGGVGLAGHLEIGDHVHFTGQSLVTRSFSRPGFYSGNLPAGPNSEWRKNVARFRHLDELAQRIRDLEAAVFQGSERRGEVVGEGDEGL
jgi:UDP-3-O-[3-hydroxymyristoyl] glucosamine N-acyltransferase